MMRLTVLLVMFLIYGAPFFSRPVEAADSAKMDFLGAARAAEKNREFKKAARLYRRAGNSPELRTQSVVALARALQELGESDEALETLKEFTERTNPFAVEPRIALVDLWIRAGKFDLAMQEIQKAELLRPGYAPLVERRGNLLFELNKTSDAITVFQEFLRSSPEAYQVRFKLAQAYFSQKQMVVAIGELKQLVEDRPSDLEAQTLLADAYFETGKSEDSEKAYRRILKVDPTSEKALVRIAELLARSGKESEAVEVYQKVVDLYPHRLEIGLKLGRLYRKLKRFQQAEAEFSRELSIDPTFASAGEELVGVFLDQKRLDLAGTLLQGFVETHPESTWASLVYAKLLADIGQVEKAEKIALRSLEVDPKDLRAGTLLSWIRVKQSKVDEALKILAAFEKNHSEDSRLKFNLGVLAELKGEESQALEYYRQISVGASTYLRGQINQALILEKQTDFPAAIGCLKVLREDSAFRTIAQAKIAWMTAKMAEPNRKIASIGRTSSGANVDFSPIRELEIF